MVALDPLRRVRKACIEWLDANVGKKRWERHSIENLWKAVHARVTDLIENLYDRKRLETVSLYKETKDFNQLTDQIVRENADVPIRTVDESYNIERFTPRHIAGSAASMVKSKWEASDTRLTLRDWIDQVLIPQSEEDRYGKYYLGKTTQTWELLKKGVKYCSREERKDFLIVSWEDGEFLDAAFELFHTGAMNSPTSGRGWAIFVVDPQGRLYAGPYAYGEFHHSSFLAGGPVQCAGEIAVDKGRVVGLTNKTGHYKAGPAELKRMLEILRTQGVDLKGVAVSDPLRARDKWFTGAEALQANGDLANLKGGDEISPPRVEP